MLGRALARRALVLVPVVLFAFLAESHTSPAPAPSPGSSSLGKRFVPEEVIIRFKDQAGPSERASARAQVSSRIVRRFRSGAEHWELGKGVTTEEAIARLRKNPHVRYVEPNYIRRIDALPNDPRYPEMDALNNTGQRGGVPGADIRAQSAWDVTTGSRDVIVAVIDTGIDSSHPDLRDNLWTNPGEIEGNGIDDDDNGFIDDVHGWDFVNGDNDPFDDNRHGTHVAGIVGAVGNNGIGVVGVNWQVGLMPLKAFGSDGSGTDADAIAAIDYAAAMGAKIINASWGGPDFDQALYDAIAGAGTQDVLFVAAAANSSEDSDTHADYPMGFDLPTIVAVTATTFDDNLAYFSNYGRTTVDLAAPGYLILSTLPGNSYGLLSGTSMATPHVAGAAALVRAARPTIDVVGLKQSLLRSVDPLPSLAGRVVTGGRLNAFRPIAVADGVPPGAIEDLSGNVAGSTVELLWTATGDDGVTGTAALYELRYSTAPIDVSNFSAATRVWQLPDPAAAGTAERFSIPGFEFATEYFFALRARDEAGNIGELSNVVRLSTEAAPSIEVDPAAFSVDLNRGETTTRTLVLHNSGAGSLFFALDIRRDATIGASSASTSALPTDEGTPAEPSGDGSPTVFSAESEPPGPLEILQPTPVPLTCIVANPLSQALYGQERGGRGFYRYSPGSDSWIRLADAPMTVNSGDAALLDGKIYTMSYGDWQMGVYDLGNDAWSVLVNPVGQYGDAITSDGERFLYLGQSSQLIRFDPISGATTSLPLPPAGFAQHSGLHYLDGQLFATLSAKRLARFDIAGNTWTSLADALHDSQSGSTIDRMKRRYYTAHGYPVYTLDWYSIDSGAWSSTATISPSYLGAGMTSLEGPYPGIYLTGYPTKLGRIATGPSYLQASVANGSIPAGGSLEVQLTLDGAHLVGGQYSARVEILSNDPVHPSLDVPVSLHVTGIPEIRLEPASLEFPVTIVGISSSLKVEITNRGTDILHIRNVVLPPGFSAAGVPETIPIGVSRTATILFSPISAGSFSGGFSVETDDPRAPVASVSISATAITSPTLRVEPASLASTFYNGNVGSPDLILSNSGGSDLSYALITRFPVQGLSFMPQAGALPPGLAPPGTLEDLSPAPYFFHCIVKDSADLAIYALGYSSGFYRYRILTNGWERLPDPPFGVGCPSFVIDGKIHSYGVNFGLYDIASNSWSLQSISQFGDSGQTAWDGGLYVYSARGVKLYRRNRSSGAVVELASPPFYVAPYNGGLSYLDGFLYAHTYSDFARYDIANNLWTTLPPLPVPSAGGSTLDPDGRVLYAFAYQAYSLPQILAYSIDERIWRSTPVPFFIGASNGGLAWFPFPSPSLYFFPGGYAQGMGRLRTGVPYLSLGRWSGTVPAGGSVTIPALFDTGVLGGGTYPAEIDVYSNDPAQPLVAVPAPLTVVEAPELNVEPPSLVFPVTFTGQTSSLGASLLNPGKQPLVLSRAQCEGPFSQTGLVTPLTIPPGGRLNFTLLFSPAEPGTASGRLILDSNDPDEPSLAVLLSGPAIPPPLASVQPASLQASVLLGQMETRTLTLFNDGGSDLQFSLGARAVFPGSGGSSAGSPATTMASPDAGASTGLGVPGEFRTLQPSPRPLGCLVEDPGDLSLYAIEAYGEGFFHYRAISDTWEELARSPGGYDCSGISLLNRKIYVTHGTSTVTVYDIAAGSWSSRAAPAGFGVDSTSDGKTYLYSIWNTNLVRWDPVTNSSALLPSAPFYVFRSGLRYHHGFLYAHSEGGHLAARFEISTGLWTQLNPSPFPISFWAALDPEANEYFVSASNGRLQRYSIAHGSWRLLDLPFTVAGPIGFLPDPVAGVYLTDSSGTRFARWIRGEFFLTLDPRTGTIPPGGSQDVSASILGGDIRPGTYTDLVVIQTNDPAHPVLEVPLTVELFTDFDQDGIHDEVDNCRGLFNPTQSDADTDGVGDPCDLCTDTDGDGAGDPEFPANSCATDNCPALANPLQANADGDSLGDGCDPCPLDPGNDTDGDALCAEVDNCPGTANPGQEDLDGDGRGDSCDNCRLHSNSLQADQDHDGVGDECDLCPVIPNPGQSDVDGDGHGDACDTCPHVPDPEQQDSNADGSGDSCQPVLTLSSIAQGEGSVLKIRAVARDPQEEPLSGLLEIFPSAPARITLNDALMNGSCDAGYLPDATPGEGVAYLNGSIGTPLIFDLDSIFGCADSVPDFEMASGTCAAPATDFQYYLELSALPVPSPLCVRRASSPENTYEWTILEIGENSLQLAPTRARPFLSLPFSSWPPPPEAISSLEPETPYRIKVSISDGNTVPVSAEQEFVYHGETSILVNNPPVSRVAAVAPAECESTVGASILLDGSSSSDPDSTPGTRDAIGTFEWSLDAGGPYAAPLGVGEQLQTSIPLGDHTITLRVTDARGESDTVTIPVSVVDTTPPLLSCAPPATFECTSPSGAAAALIASASDACGAVTVHNSRNEGGADGSGVYPLGETSVEFTATDTSGNSAACSTEVLVRDTSRPVVTVAASQQMLWPPNHRLVPIRISAAASDACSAGQVALLVSALSSEPDDAPGTGDGSTAGDVQDANPGTPDAEISLRAERAGNGTGRTYELRYRSSDAAGNVGEGVLTIRVPRDDPSGIDPLRLHLDGGVASGGSRITWDEVTSATGYDVIRGDLLQISRGPVLISLGEVSVLARGAQESDMLNDLATPPVGEVFFYLAQYRLPDGTASGYGTESTALPREPASCIAGCPEVGLAASGTIVPLEDAKRPSAR